MAMTGNVCKGVCTDFASCVILLGMITYNVVEKG